ncbi:hypothetical protein ACWDSD_41685 [Streptomyces spiralis]
MAGHGRGGRPWGPIQAESQEAKALAVFMRQLVDHSDKTMTAIAQEIHLSKSQTGRLLSGKVPEKWFVTALVTATVNEPRLRDQQLAKAEKLLHAALHPASGRSQTASDSSSAAVELARVREQQVETYDRLTRALERQAELERTATNSARLVMVLLTMVSTLEHRVKDLTAERDQLREQSGEPGALQAAQRQLARAQDQERRAQEELRRAQDKQHQAQQLAHRVQQQVEQLTDELDRLRAGDAEVGPEDVATDAPAGAGPGVRTGAGDPVGDDIEQALAQAAAVNDADRQWSRPRLSRTTGTTPPPASLPLQASANGCALCSIGPGEAADAPPTKAAPPQAPSPSGAWPDPAIGGVPQPRQKSLC